MRALTPRTLFLALGIAICLSSCGALHADDAAEEAIRADIARPFFVQLPPQTCVEQRLNGDQVFDGIDFAWAPGAAPTDFSFLSSRSWLVRVTVSPFVDAGLYVDAGGAGRSPLDPRCFNRAAKAMDLEGIVFSEGQVVNVDLGHYVVDDATKINEFAGTDPRGYQTTLRSYKVRFHFEPKPLRSLQITEKFGRFECTIVAALDQATKMWRRSSDQCMWYPS